MPSPREVEVAAENVLRDDFGCKETRRAVRTKFQKVDFFGADIIARNGSNTFWVQVTKSTPSSHGTRKRDELMFRGDGGVRGYGPDDRVMVFYYDPKPDPEDGRRKVYRFKVQEWVNRSIAKASSWAWNDDITFPRSFFKTGATV